MTESIANKILEWRKNNPSVKEIPSTLFFQELKEVPYSSKQYGFSKNTRGIYNSHYDEPFYEDDDYEKTKI